MNDVVDFFHTHAPHAWGGTEEALRQHLAWYQSRGQLVVLREGQAIVGVIMANLVSSLTFLERREFPPDDLVRGTILWISLAAFRKDYRDRSIVPQALMRVLARFPQVRYVAFQRADQDGRVVMKPIEAWLSRRRRDVAVAWTN